MNNLRQIEKEEASLNKYIPLILAGVLLNAAAQIVIKKGMTEIGTFDFSLNSLMPIGLKVATSPYVITGIFFYVVSLVIWLMVLSRVDVSYAYPMLSIGYIAAALFGKYFFGEPVGPVRWAGIIVICIGVYLITRSAT